MSQKHTATKANKITRMICAFTLFGQFIAVLLTAMIADKKDNKQGVTILVIISSIGGLFGAYMLYKDLVEPRLAERISDFTLDDTYDDFDVYADLMGEPDTDDSVPEDDENR